MDCLARSTESLMNHVKKENCLMFELFLNSFSVEAHLQEESSSRSTKRKISASWIVY